MLAFAGTSRNSIQILETEHYLPRGESENVDAGLLVASNEKEAASGNVPVAPVAGVEVGENLFGGATCDGLPPQARLAELRVVEPLPGRVFPRDEPAVRGHRHRVAAADR